MEELQRLLEEVLTFDLIQGTVSGPRQKGGILKIKIRPVIIRDELLFQASEQEEKKIFHRNYEKQAMIQAVTKWLSEDFSQLQLNLSGERITVLSSRKGKLTVRRKRQACEAVPRERSHDRRKRYILREGQPVPFLQDLGVMTSEGKIVKARYDKFRQINRFLEFIEDVLPKLPKEREITIVDFGCGKSYLTFAMYYYLKELKGYDIRVIGLDLKEDVIEHCSRLKDAYGYEKLSFCVGDIASYEGLQSVDMVVTLHACDTATDHALYKAVHWDASVILSVPCCQHECNRQLNNELLAPVLKYGLIKERMAALLTDGMRANLLEQQGYQVQLLEFIDMEHTPKNILIRAVKSRDAAGPDGKLHRLRKTDAAYERMRDSLHTELTLERLLRMESGKER